jgi:hypothetical protein
MSEVSLLISVHVLSLTPSTIFLKVDTSLGILWKHYFNFLFSFQILRFFVNLRLEGKFTILDTFLSFLHTLLLSRVDILEKSVMSW